jgi:Family of unknown function (DUF5309)
MAAPVPATKSYDLSGGALREDLQDIIYDISPMDTKFISTAGRGTAQSTTHEWLVDALAAATNNAAIEGDDHSAVARSLPSRLKNYTQISREDIVVTGTSRALNNAGMREILAYHTARAGREIKRDMEYGVLNNNPATAGSSVSARVSASVPNWIYSGQHYKATNSSGTLLQTTQTTTAPASGFAKSDGTTWTNSATAFTEAMLSDMLKLAWSTGGEVDTILCDSVAFNKFSTFTGVAQRFRDVGSRQPAQIIGYADLYVSPYGTHKLVLSRYMPANSAYALQMDKWEIAYLRPFATEEIAKAGDSDKRMLLAEWTLVAKNPLANAKAHGVA